MTQPHRPPAPGPGGSTRPAPGGEPDAERVLAQALRAMAGGGRQTRPDDDAGRLRLTRLQILLIAVIAGLVIGISVGLISLV